MASASSLPCEEQFLCSICLQAFTEPVSTPCGHNYCKACITGYWDSSKQTQCPLCKKSFCGRPQLQVNTEFRDMMELFQSMRVKGGNEILAKPGEVSCDVCLGPKVKAQKTCLVCLASYCQPHLEDHQRVERFKKHRMTDPVSNLEDRVCKKHDKMLELFCCADQACVCFMCLKDDHVAHEAMPLERAFAERKAWLENVTSEMKVMENFKSRSVKEMKYSVEQSKKESERAIADVVEAFAALVANLQKSQAELIVLIQEKQKEAQTQAEDHITKLEQEVAELRGRRSEMEQLLQTEDHLHLLQSWPSNHFPAHTDDLFSFLFQPVPPQDLSDISQQIYVGMVKKSVAQMEKTLSNEMEMLLRGVRLSDGCASAQWADATERLMTDYFITEVWNPPQDRLMMIQQCDAVDVTLDAYTANSGLVVSEDGKQLAFRKSRLFFPLLFGRKFEHQPFVLATDGFSSGRFYYEVRVSGSNCWLLGVVKESINRDIASFPSIEEGGWILGGVYTQTQQGCFTVGNPCPLYPSRRPQRVGIFVDCEKGEVAFYDVDARTLIYSFTGCTFTETTPALKAILFSMAGTSLSNRLKLYPFFGIYDIASDDTLVITPVDCAT